MSDSENKWVNELFSKSEMVDKIYFINFLKENKLQLDVEKVHAVGYQGASEYIYVTDPKLATCCCCKSYFICEYISDVCDEHPVCYDCAIGNNDGECYKKVEQRDLMEKFCEEYMEKKVESGDLDKSYIECIREENIHEYHKTTEECAQAIDDQIAEIKKDKESNKKKLKRNE